MDPHAFTPSPGSTRCAVPGCGSPRLAMIHAVRPPFFEGTLDSEADATLPFPQEPAFNSPEAVEQAAVTICEYAGKLAQIPSQTDLLAEIERLRLTLSNLEAHLDETRGQRDDLADALEALLRETGYLDAHPPIGRARAVGCGALRKAGRLS